MLVSLLPADENISAKELLQETAVVVANYPKRWIPSYPLMGLEPSRYIRV